MRVVGFYGAAHCGAGHAAVLTKAGAAVVFADMAGLPAIVAQTQREFA
jgi:hypothetical protein